MVYYVPSSPWWRRRNRRACAGPAPSLRRSLNSSLPPSGRVLGPPRRAAVLPPLLPCPRDSVPSSSRGADRGREPAGRAGAGPSGARSGPVGARLVRFGLVLARADSRERERERERRKGRSSGLCVLAFLAGFGSLARGVCLFCLAVAARTTTRRTRVEFFAWCLRVCGGLVPKIL